jgi:hypothetical protein
MLRVITFLAIIISAGSAWALDWGVCQRDLNDLRKDASASYLVTASYQANKLQNLYDDILLKRFEYDRCNTSADGTQYCVYTQRKMNALIIKYQTGRQNFDKLMLSQNKPQSKDESCGFKLN